MANIRVNYAEMEEVAARLRVGESELKQEIERLKRQVDELVLSGFVTDESSKAFQAYYDQFTQGATKTMASLNNIAQSVMDMRGSLSQMDASLAKALTEKK